MGGFLSNMGEDFVLDHFIKPAVMRYTHIHPQYEMYFCPENLAQTSVINGVEYSYRYPCAILSSPYTVHSMSCNDETAKQYDRYVFYFHEKTLNLLGEPMLPIGLIKKNTGLLFRLSEQQAGYLKRLLVLGEEMPMTVTQKELIFALFMNKLFEFCPEEHRVSVGTPSMYIQEVLRHISENMGAQSDSDQLARKFSVSRSKLDRDFKRFTGVTVHRFLEICRINQAKYLLQFHKELSIGEIAEICGFESETYFFPFFKKHTGQTPIEYRKNSVPKQNSAGLLRISEC